MKKVLCCLFGLLLLFGCECEVHDNYIDRDKPVGTIDMGILLNADNNGDTIIIWDDYMTVRYNLVTSGPRAMGCIFQLGNQRWEIPGSEGVFEVNKSNIGSSGQYELVCEMYAYTGSGSIAEQVGEEAYQGTYKWPVKVISRPDGSELLSHRINEDGYLELSWDKLPFDNSLIDRYEITNRMWYVTSITDVNQLSYVCKWYVGQEAGFMVTAYFKDNRSPWRLGRLVLNALDIEPTFDYSRTDSIVMKWSNPYRGVISVRDNRADTMLIEDVSNREVCLPYGRFGTNNPYTTITIQSADQAARGAWEGLSVNRHYRSSPGTVIASNGNWPRYGYNPTGNMIYVSSYGEVDRWVYPFTIRLDTYQGPDGNNINQYAWVDKHTAIAAYHGSSIDVFTGGGVNKVKHISSHGTGYFAGRPTVTNNGKVIAFTYTATFTGIAGEVYDINSGLFETEFSVPSLYKGGGDAIMTPDGAYLMDGLDNGLLVVSMNGYKAGEVRTLAGSFNGWCVNTANSDELYLSFNGKISKYKTSNLSLVASWNMPGMRVGNVDPESGYLLVYNFEEIAVIDPKANRVIYSRPVDATGFKLYGNMLLSDTGYALNLGKELSK